MKICFVTCVHKICVLDEPPADPMDDSLDPVLANIDLGQFATGNF